jgi:hypothetical protein
VTEPSEPTSFFAPAPAEERDHGEEIAESHPFDADLPADASDPSVRTLTGEIDPLTAPAGTFETWDATPLAPPTFEASRPFPLPDLPPAPADVPTLAPVEPAGPVDRADTDSAAAVVAAADPQQLQLAQLLAELRAILPAAAGAAGDRQAVTDQLRAELAAVREVHAAQYAELAGRLDRLTAAIGASTARLDQLAVPAPPTGYDEITLQDVHDGLAGVRTDIGALPDQLGPGVTSAVAHGMASTAAQVASVAASLGQTSEESARLRAQLTELAGHVAVLPGAVEELQTLSTRLSALEAASSGRDLDAIVDRQLSEHLMALSAGIGERLDVLAAAISAVSQEQAGSHERLADLATHDGLAAWGERLGSLVAEGRPDLSWVASREAVEGLAERLGSLVAEGRPDLSWVASREAVEGLAERLGSLVAEGRPDLSWVASREAVEGLAERLGSLVAEGRPDLSALATKLDIEGLRPPVAAEGPDPALVALLDAAEQRLSRHVDEAVLALAQAVLRRRPASAAPPSEQSWTQPVAVGLSDPSDPVEPAWSARPEPLTDDAPPVESAEASADADEPQEESMDVHDASVVAALGSDVELPQATHDEHQAASDDTQDAGLPQVTGDEPGIDAGAASPDQTEPPEMPPLQFGALQDAGPHPVGWADEVTDAGEGHAASEEVGDPGHAGDTEEGRLVPTTESDLIDDDPQEDGEEADSSQEPTADSARLLDEHHEVWAKGDALPASPAGAGPEGQLAGPPAWTGLDPPESEPPVASPDVLPEADETAPRKRGLFRRRD